MGSTHFRLFLMPATCVSRVCAGSIDYRGSGRAEGRGAVRSLEVGGSDFINVPHPGNSMHARHFGSRMSDLPVNSSPNHAFLPADDGSFTDGNLDSSNSPPHHAG